VACCFSRLICMSPIKLLAWSPKGCQLSLVLVLVVQDGLGSCGFPSDGGGMLPCKVGTCKELRRLQPV
jgi:hypothetical protein